MGALFGPYPLHLTMYLPLTDLLTCPRCGPDHGLILLANRIEDRRVLEGTLGCPRCHARFPVVDGFADLRVDSTVPGRGEPPIAAAEDREAAIRMAALLGLAEGVRYVLVVGPGVAHAPGVAALVEGVEVIACAEAVRGWDEEHGVSRLAADGTLPFASGMLGGVALTGPGSADLLEEAARVLARAGRLLLEPAPEGAVERLEGLGLALLAQEGEVVVATRV